MYKKLLAGAAVVISLAGCLPVELSISSEGTVLIARQEGFFVLDPPTGKLTRVFAPADAQPAFGRFSPDGRQVLAISCDKAGNQSDFYFDLVKLGDGSSRSLREDPVSNVTYVNFSPDGKQISFTRQSDKQDPDLEENLPELHLIDVGTAKDHLVESAGCVAGLHRWFPDSKSLLLFQIKQKADAGGYHEGTITRWDVAARKGVPLAAALGANDGFFDLSADGKTVLFTAAAAGKLGSKLTAGNADMLYELKIETGALREVRSGVRYALWSKTGTSVLLAGGPDDNMRLEVSDASLTEFHTVATDAVAKAGGATFYPSWIGDGQILYLASRAVYGTAGRNLRLVIVSADGKTRKDFQTAIDTAAEH